MTESHGITPISLEDVRDAWDSIVNGGGHVPYEYMQTVVKYQSAYVAEKSETNQNLNVVLFSGEKLLGDGP